MCGINHITFILRKGYFMTFNVNDFSFDVAELQNDLNRVDKLPGDSKKDFLSKFVQLPKAEGSITLRFLPPVQPDSRGVRRPYSSTRLHYINGRSYHCLCELENGKWKNRGECPICVHYNNLYREAENIKDEKEIEALRKLASSIKPIERYYYNCIVRKEIDPDTGEVKLNVGPKIYSAGKSVHARILRAYVGNVKLDEPPLGNISHPITGRDFKINKELRSSGGDNFPNYDSSKFLEESRLGTDAEIQKWLSTLHNLEDLRLKELKSVDELQRQIDIFRGIIEDDSGYQQTSAKPSTTTVVAMSGSNKEAPATKVASKPAKKNEDLPFDIEESDKGLADDEWLKDFHKTIAD